VIRTSHPSPACPAGDPVRVHAHAAVGDVSLDDLDARAAGGGLLGAEGANELPVDALGGGLLGGGADQHREARAGIPAQDALDDLGAEEPRGAREEDILPDAGHAGDG
jgi:hypothetical protein